MAIFNKKNNPATAISPFKTAKTTIFLRAFDKISGTQQML